MSSVYLRQVAFIAAQLRPVIEDLNAVLGLEVCYIDDEVEIFGLKNSLLRLGTNFIEVVQPIRPGTAGGRYLERRGGDGGYMVITQALDSTVQAACRERAKAAGIRIAWEKTHETGRYMQLHPRDTGGCFLEIDSTTDGDPSGCWPPAGGVAWLDCHSPEGIVAILAVEIQAAAPEMLAHRWAEVLGGEIERAGDAIVVPLANAALRFVDARDDRGEGLSGIELAVRDRARITQAAAAQNCLSADGGLTIGGVGFALTEV